MQLWRGGLDGDGLGRAAGGRRLGLGLLLHGVVVRHATVGHLGLTLRQIQITPNFIIHTETQSEYKV